MRDAATQQLLEGLMRLTRTLKTGRFRTDATGVELNRAEVGVLRWLERHGEGRSTDLACGFGLSPSVISRQLSSLVERDLVARRPDPSDARASLISLTSAGARSLDAMTDYYVGRLADILDDWPEGDLVAAARIVENLAERLADGAEQAPEPSRSAPALV